MVENAVALIQSVDNITDKNMIREWVQAIPPGYLKIVTGLIDNASEWGPSLKIDKTCSNCQQEIKIDVMLNPISFFS